VLGNDTDADNLSPTAPNAGLTVSGVGAASHGTTAFTANGVTYTPASNYYGPDSFTYTIVDAQGNIASATVSVTVTNVADAPVANPDSATVNEDSGATFIDVLGNDTDADNLSPTPSNTGLTVSGVGAASHGRRPSPPAA
jgi:hypothetical protein